MFHFLNRSYIKTNLFIIMMYIQLLNAQNEGEYLVIGNGTIPFTNALSKGFHPGGSIVVNGKADPHSQRFDISLENESGSKVYLHIRVRLTEKRIEFSNKDDDVWSPGYDPYSRSLSSLIPGSNFTITMQCNATGYMINVNKRPVFFFDHRFDTTRIRNIRFTEINKEEVTFEDIDTRAKTTSPLGSGIDKPKNAFRRGTRYRWHSYAPLPQSLWYEFPAPIVVNQFSFQSRLDVPDLSSSDGPSEYLFWGSNADDCEDSSKWVTLFQDNSGTPFASAQDIKEGKFENAARYKCYGFNVIKTPGRESCEYPWGGHCATISNVRFFIPKGSVTINSVLYKSGNGTCQFEGCADNEECVFDFEDNQFQCQCIDGYSGHRCQDSCKVNGCNSNEVCVFSNEKYFCRSGTDLAGHAGNNSNIQCRHPYVAVDSECIWVVKTKLNWDAARFHCENTGGFLLEPDFPRKFNQFMITNYPRKDWGGYWIGGADRGLQRWVWVTSHTDVQDDFPWGEGEPNDSGSRNKEDCMNLFFTTERPYWYNDSPCNNDYFYICETHPIVSNSRATAVQVGEIAASPGQDLQIQVAILMLLIITMIMGAGLFIHKKDTCSFGFRSKSFSTQIPGALIEDNDDKFVNSDCGIH